MIKRILVLCMMLTTFSLFQSNIQAAVFGVSATNNGNGTTTVTISGPCVGGFTVSAGSASTSIAKTTLEASASVTLSTGAGTFTVTATAISVSDASYNLIEGSTSTTVTVTDATSTPPPSNGGNSGGTSGGGTPPPNTTPEAEKTDPEEKTEKDKNSSLSALTISTGTLSPAFAAGTTSYSVALPNGTTELDVAATPASAKASVSGTGKVTLNAGANTIEVRVTAEDGSATLYTIVANVSEKALASVQMGKQEYGVLNTDLDPGKLFAKTKVKIDGKEVDAWENKSLKMTLLYLQDNKSNEKNFYIYDTSTKKVTSIYKPFAYAGKNLVQVDVPANLQKRKGMKFTTVEMGQYKLPGWTFTDKKFANYSVIYVLDETGKALYYQYDKKEDSLQLFSNAAAITQDAYESYVEKMEKQQNYLFIGLLVTGILAVLFFSLMLIFYFRKKKPLKYQKIDVKSNDLQSSIRLETEALLQENEDE